MSSAQTTLMLQEETIRRLERERKVQNEKILALETSMTQGETDKRMLRDKCAKSQKNEARGEKEREAMRAQINNAESRVTRMDLKKKALEGKTFYKQNAFSFYQRYFARATGILSKIKGNTHFFLL